MAAYNVTLHNQEDLEQFYLDMEEHTCLAQRPLSLNTEYSLTEEIAELLRDDPRILAVEEIGEEPSRPTFSHTSSTWYKGNVDNSNRRNWALLRCSEGEPRSTWGSDGTLSQSDTAVTQTNGNKVDLVIMDGAPVAAHPEFAVNVDGTGGSRVQEYNWLQNTTAAGVGSSNGTYDYSDSSAANIGHGTACAGLAAGNTQGFAPQAHIFSFDPFGDVTLTGTTGSRTGAMLDLIKYWHNTKPIDSSTGVVRPTVMNFSLFQSYESPIYTHTNEEHRPWCRIGDIAKVNYRGTTYSGPFDEADLLGYKIQPNVQPKIVIRPTATVSSGSTSFTAIVTSNTGGSADFLLKSFTDSGFYDTATPLAAQNTGLNGLNITNIVDASAAYTYQSVSYPVYTITVNSGTSANLYADSGFQFTYSEKVLGMVNKTDTASTTDIGQMQAAGIHVVSSSGNQNAYQDTPGGADFNNYMKIVDFRDSTEKTYYYNRGHWSAQTSLSTVVGNIDNTVVEQKAEDSNKGPGVTIYAPGTGCATAATSYYSSAVDDPRNSSFKQMLFYGVSAATPQTAGVLASALAAYPYVSPEQGKSYLEDGATVGDIIQSNPTTMAGTRFLDGAPNRFLFQAATVGLDTGIVQVVSHGPLTGYTNGATTNTSTRTLLTGEFLEARVRIYGISSNVAGDIVSASVVAGSNTTVENTTLSWSYTDAFYDYIESSAFNIKPIAEGNVSATVTVVLPNGSSVNKTHVFNITTVSGSHGLVVYNDNGTARLDTRKRYVRFHSRASGTENGTTQVSLSVPGASPDGTWGVNNVESSSKWEATIGSNSVTLTLGTTSGGFFFYNDIVTGKYDVLVYRI